MTAPAIDDLKALQRRLHLGDVHVCWIGPRKWVVAHTDGERESGADLTTCDLSVWLSAQTGPPERVGYYAVVPHEADAYSEPYPVQAFDFERLDP